MELHIALAGNPNSGKTTLFNALTGSNQFVGNWPGVTVEKKEGAVRGREGVTVVDLPGIYSLSPYTLEEVVARKYLVGERPDAILNVVDGTNIERNLYLTTQLIELGIPVVIAVNMMDIVRRNGDKIDFDGLSKALGCPVFEVSALKETGIDEVVLAAIAAAGGEKPMTQHIFSGAVEHALAHIEEAAVHDMPEEQHRWYAIKIFERDEHVMKELSVAPEVMAHIEADIKAAEREKDDDAESIVTNERYLYITDVVKRTCKKRKGAGLSVSDKIDRVLTNRFLALPIFALVMFLVYFISVTTVGTWATDFMNEGVFGEGFVFFGTFVPSIPVLLGNAMQSAGVWPWLQGLVIDGIVGGVGAVLGFLPQLLVLFLMLSFLEACGYMSRVAFVLDRIFRKFGLSGKSFIPLLVGTGCSVPGIMASRTIENDRDRRMTVMTTSFVPCGAKLPIIALIAGSFFGGAWWMAPLAYFVGITAVIVSGVILKKTKRFAGDVAPFVMELPAYHLPTLKNLFSTVWERGFSFVKKAGSVILISSVAIWAVSHFGYVDGVYLFDMDMALTDSVLGGIGVAIGWIFAPLGFGRIETAIATVMGLLAKEEVVAVLGVLEFTEMSSLAAFSFMVFNLLCAPCVAAMGAIKREMNDMRWTLFAIGYQCGLAYAVSFCIYQIGSLVSGEVGAGNIIGTALAAVIIAFTVYMLFKPYKPATHLADETSST